MTSQICLFVNNVLFVNFEIMFDSDKDLDKDKTAIVHNGGEDSFRHTTEFTR